MEPWMIVLCVMAVYLFFTFFIGALAGFIRVGSLDEYLNASRSLGMVTTYFLLGASVFSASAFLGGPGWAYSRGAAAFYLLAFCATGCWSMYIYGPRIMALGRRYGYSTQCELLQGRFPSRVLPVLIATATSVAFVLYMTLQVKGCGYVFSTLTGGKVSFWTGALISYGVVLAYVFWGGVRGVAWATVLQGMFMIGIAWFLGIYIPLKLYGGWAPMFREIAAAKPDLLIVGAKGSGISMAEFSSNIVISFLGFMMWPHLFIRPFNIKSLGTMKRTILIYPTFALMQVPVMIVGFAGILRYPLGQNGLNAGDEILPYATMQLLSSAPFVIGLVGAGALSAAMSTQAAITHAAALSFAKDIYGNIVGRQPAPRTELWIVRGAVVIFGALSIWIATGTHSLVLLLLMAYNTILQLLPVVIAALYWRRATTPGVIAGFSAGVGLTIVLELCKSLSTVTPGQIKTLHPFFATPMTHVVDLLQRLATLVPVSLKDIRTSVIALMVNILLVILVSLATRPQDPEHVGKFVDVLEPTAAGEDAA